MNGEECICISVRVRQCQSGEGNTYHPSPTDAAIQDGDHYARPFGHDHFLPVAVFLIPC